MTFVGFSIHYIILWCASAVRNLLPAEKNLIGKKLYSKRHCKTHRLQYIMAPCSLGSESKK